MKKQITSFCFHVGCIPKMGGENRIAHQREVVFFPPTPQPLVLVRVAAPKGRKQQATFR